jgi:hypothetical protein
MDTFPIDRTEWLRRPPQRLGQKIVESLALLFQQAQRRQKTLRCGVFYRRQRCNKSADQGDVFVRGGEERAVTPSERARLDAIGQDFL